MYNKRNDSDLGFQYLNLQNLDNLEMMEVNGGSFLRKVEVLCDMTLFVCTETVREFGAGIVDGFKEGFSDMATDNPLN